MSMDEADTSQKTLENDYLSRADGRGKLMKEAIISFHDMRMLLEKRSAIRKARNRSLVKYDPFQGQGRVLVCLSDNDGASQAELARLMDITPQTLSTAIRKLEREGLVERRPSEQDARQLRVLLTDTGREALESLRLMERYSGSMFESLTDEELGAITAISKKLSVHLKAEMSAADAADSFFRE